MSFTNSDVNVSPLENKKINLLEAALHVAGYPLGLKTLGSILNISSEDKVLELARKLCSRYEKWNTPLEILELKDNRFVLQVKPEYAQKVKKVSLQKILTSGPLTTLSFIAYHQPVLQTSVIDARGTHSYNHLKILENLNLISRKNRGRTKLRRTPETFTDYLGLSRNIRTMKRQLEKIFKSLS